MSACLPHISPENLLISPGQGQLATAPKFAHAWVTLQPQPRFTTKKFISANKVEMINRRPRSFETFGGDQHEVSTPFLHTLSCPVRVLGMFNGFIALIFPSVRWVHPHPWRPWALWGWQCQAGDSSALAGSSGNWKHPDNDCSAHSWGTLHTQWSKCMATNTPRASLWWKFSFWDACLNCKRNQWEQCNYD